MSLPTNKTLILLLTVLLAAGIFYIDTFLPIGVAGCVPYILVILLSILLSHPSAPIMAAIVCTALTYSNLAFFPAGNEWGMMFFNRSLAVLAIWTTAILGSQGKQHIRDLEISEERYRALYHDNPSMYCTLSREGTILSMNKFGAQQLGYSVAELQGQPISMLVAEEDRDVVQNKLKQSALIPQELNFWELRKICKDGSRIWVRESARMVKDQDDQGLLLVVSHNITEQKEAEEQNRQHERAVHELYEITSSTNQSFEYRVRALLALGCRRFRLPIGLLTHRVSDELELQFVCSSDPAFREGQRVSLDNTLCSVALFADAPISFEHAAQSEWRDHPGYTAFGLETYLGTKVVSGSEAYGTFCFTGREPHPTMFSEADKDFLRLIARWVGAELERFETEKFQRRLVTILETTTDLIGMADTNGHILYVNPAGKTLMGMTEDEDPLGMPISNFHPPSAKKTLIEEAIPQILEAGVWEGDSTILTRDEKEIPVSQVLLAQNDSMGDLECFTTIIRDISERKTAEENLQKAYQETRELSARLEAAEESERKRIARELHDEFGQMLAALKFDLAWIQRRLAEQPSRTPNHTIMNKTRSMSELTDKLIHTVRRIATSLRPSILDDLGLIPALEWQTKEFQNRTGITCLFLTELDSSTVPLESDHATALFRISQELFTNILRHAEASQVELRLQKQNGFLTLSVHDNGQGLSDHKTAQPASLGLLGIRERVASFGGDFLIQGKSGQGTQARVRLPISQTQLV